MLSSQQVPSVEVLLLPSIWLQPHSCLFVGICSSCESAGIFCIVFKRMSHIFDCSIRNSDPGMRIVLVHGLNSNFNSILEVLETGRDFQYRSYSHISLDPPFWLRSSVVSWKGVFATKPLIEIWNCLKSPVSSVTKYCPNFNNTQKILLPYKIYSICFLVKAIQFVECIVAK